MTFAIIKVGSKQYKITEGDTLKLQGFIEMPKYEVLSVFDGKNLISDKSQLVEYKVGFVKESAGRDRKISVGRYKSKSRYDKTNGYREQYSKFVVKALGSEMPKDEVVTEGKVVKKSIKDKGTVILKKTKTEKPKSASKKLPVKKSDK